MIYRVSLSHLRAQFRSFALEPETLYLLNSEKAIDLIERATAEGASLAGVEGFVATSAGAYEPRQDFSNDIAGWQGSSSEFVESTRELLERGAHAGVRFQVIFDSE
jgi:hypothetical protein